MVETRTVDKAMKVLKDYQKTPEERKEFVKTLTEDEMRSIFIDMCDVWSYKNDD